MIIGLIFAGGTGERMNSKTKPKQFLTLHGKPIIIHTIEHFELHPMIDIVVVVCLDGWVNQLEILVKKYSLSKVKYIVKGGETPQQSIYSGLKAISDQNIVENSIVLIHDGVRPLISEDLITRNINCVKEKGNAITVSYATETIVEIDNNTKIKSIPDREIARIGRAPQSFFYRDILEVHEKAMKDGIFNTIDSATLMKKYNFELNTVVGSQYNIKITTPSDYYIFRAIYEARENSQIFGL